jgi:hypothetical protein
MNIVRGRARLHRLAGPVGVERLGDRAAEAWISRPTRRPAVSALLL